MSVRVRYFAALRERKGIEVEEIAFLPGETLGALYQRLFPSEEGGLMLPVAYARNQMTSGAEEPVRDGDEIAFLPPIGGG